MVTVRTPFRLSGATFVLGVIGFARPCLAQAPAGSMATNCGTDTPSLDHIDLYHPRNFVRILEVTESEDTLPILSATEDGKLGRSVREDVNAQVDRDSRVIVTFDRPWIICQSKRFEAEIVIRGEVSGPDGKRNIEVPGYSIVGEATRTASARIRSSNELVALLHEFRNNWEDVNEKLNAAQLRAERFGALPPGLRDTLQAAQRDSATWYDRWSNAYYALSQSNRPERGPRDLSAQRLVDSLYREAQGAHQLLERLRARPEYRHAVWPTYVQSARRELLEQRAIIELPLARLADTLNVVLLEALAQQLEQVPQALLTRGQIISSQLLTRLATSDSLFRAGDPKAVSSDRIAEDYDILEQIRGALGDLSQLGDRLGNEDRPQTDLARSLTGYLKDTDILVSQTGAQPGDEILLIISNGEGRPTLSRTLRVRIRVAQYGWVRGVTDSFLLLKRLHVDQGANQRDEQSARQQAQAQGTPTTVETPLSTDFEPAAGATLGWTYIRRKGQGRFGNFVRWLQPGFGINVSFPQFGSKISSFAPSGAATPPTATVTVSNHDIDIGFGVIAGLFNNALVVTYGSNLTAAKPRSYWGLGFSFVKIVKGVTQGATGSASQ